MRIRRMLDVIESVLLWLIAVPVVVIVVDTALTFFEGRPGNPIVAFFSDGADALTPVPVEDLLVDQTYWQTALLALAAYALVVVLFVVLFRALRKLATALEQPAEAE